MTANQLRPWTLPEALQFTSRIDRHFQAAGWMLALYGSLLRSFESYPASFAWAPCSDLDLIAVPRVTQPLPSASVISSLKAEWNLTISDEYQGLIGTVSYVLILNETKQAIDVQFRV